MFFSFWQIDPRVQIENIDRTNPMKCGKRLELDFIEKKQTLEHAIPQKQIAKQSPQTTYCTLS